MKTTDALLIEWLVERCESLRPLLQDHVAANDELLPYVLLADVTLWLVNQYEPDPAGGNVACVLRELEAAFVRGSQSDGELIATAFVDSIPSEGEPADGMRTAIGPALREDLERSG
jgi:hypothetical protein